MAMADKSNSELGVGFLNAYKALEETGWALAQAIRVEDHALPAWVPMSEAEKKDHALEVRTVAARAIDARFYYDDQDPKRTPQRPGLIGCSPPTLILAHAYNDAKDAFKHVMAEISGQANEEAADIQRSAKAGQDQHRKNVRHKILSYIKESRNEKHKKIMARGKLAHLSLMQCYRHVPIIEQAPQSVSFRLVPNINMEPFTRDELIKELNKREAAGGHSVGLSLNRLNALSTNEILVVRRVYGVGYRTNVRNAQGKMTSKVAHTPILVPVDSGDTLPRHNEVKYMTLEKVIEESEKTKEKLDEANHDKSRLRRQYARLEIDPYIPYPPVYRFRVGEKERLGLTGAQ